MRACGYESGYVAQGGDWGGFLSRLVAKLYPESVKAVHTNFPVHTFPKLWRNPVSFAQAVAGIALDKKTREDLAYTQKVRGRFKPRGIPKGELLMMSVTVLD